MLIEVERQLVFQILPEPLNRIKLRAVRRQKREFDVARNREFIGLMELAVIQNHDVLALGKRLRKPIQEVLEADAVQTLVFGEKPLAGFWLNGSVEIKVVVGRLRGLDRLYTRQGNSMPNRGHQSNPALILAEQAHGPAGIGPAGM